jgi:hypothetical protein
MTLGTDSINIYPNYLLNKCQYELYPLLKTKIGKQIRSIESISLLLIE